MNNIVDISFAFVVATALFKISLSLSMFYQLFLGTRSYLNLKQNLNCFCSTKMSEANSSSSIEQLTNVSEPALLKWTLRVLYILVFVVGITGNLVVCCAVMRRKRLRSSNNLYTFNLACADLIVVTIYVPTQMTAFENEHNWALGDTMCRIAYIIIPL